MPGERSMSAAHDQGTEDSSSLSSLPLKVEVESCPEDQYLDESKNCKPCTVCGPGTQHKNDEECGYGQGSNQTCERCSPGSYQDTTSYILVRCKPCITCDKLANTTRECSPEHNAKCGPCRQGFYYFQENTCISCEQDRTREECRMTTPITPEPTTAVPPPVVSDATPTAPADIVNATDQTGITSEGTERNTTEPTVQGGVNWILVGASLGGTIIGLLVIIAALVKLYKFLKPGRRADEETGRSAEGGSTSGRPGANFGSDNRQDETIRFGGIVLEDDMAQAAQPQYLQSNVP